MAIGGSNFNIFPNTGGLALSYIRSILCHISKTEIACCIRLDDLPCACHDENWVFGNLQAGKAAVSGGKNSCAGLYYLAYCWGLLGRSFQHERH